MIEIPKKYTLDVVSTVGKVYTKWFDPCNVFKREIRFKRGMIIIPTYENRSQLQSMCTGIVCV